jgi:TolB protein
MGRCVLCAVVAAAAVSFAPAAEAGTFPGGNGRIAFAAPIGGVSQVFTMRADGRGAAQVTHDPAGASDPDWASNGREFVYARNDGLATLATPTGAHVQDVLTQQPITDPALSPDGKRIVFTVNGDGQWDGPSIYVANVDGSGLQRLTGGSTPQWSPNGRWLAYVSVPADTGCSAVRLMQPDGSDDHPVAAGSLGPGDTCRDSARDPSFSPNSRRVIYVATGIRTPHSANGSDIYTASIHGGLHKRLTRDDLTESHPTFSPDGRKVLFTTTGGKGRENGTWTISAGGGNRHRIGPPRGGLSWQPLPGG